MTPPNRTALQETLVHHQLHRGFDYISMQFLQEVGINLKDRLLSA